MTYAIFIISWLFTGLLALQTIKNWRHGLIGFFIFIQLSGFIKRFMLGFGSLSSSAYVSFVGQQYLLLFLIVVVSLFTNHLKIKTPIVVGLLFFFFLLLISIMTSPYSLGIVFFPAVLQYFPILIIIPAYRLKREDLFKLERVWFISIWLHVIYHIKQFLIGPFDFEQEFIESTSSVYNTSTGDFYRGIPLYDNVEPLYLHMLIASLLLLRSSHKKIVKILLMLLLLATPIMMGNRGGLVIILFAIAVAASMHYTFLRINMRLAMTFLILSLSIVGTIFNDFIVQYKAINVSVGGSEDFNSRITTLRTFSDRIVGRFNSDQNLSLLGKGFGSSGLIINVIKNKGVSDDVPDHGGLFAHDLVGEIQLDFGILGLLVLFALYIKILFSNHRKSPVHFYILFIVSFTVASLLGGSYFLGRSAYFSFFAAGLFFNKNLYEKEDSYILY